MNSAMHKLT